MKAISIIVVQSRREKSGIEGEKGGKEEEGRYKGIKTEELTGRQKGDIELES